MFARLSKKNKVYFINIIAEFSGSALYSFLYFILIGRFLSPKFGVDLVTTSIAIGFAYFMAVYVPFHTYRIHINPFVSVIMALQKKKWRVIYHKIPVQIAGGFLGVGMFHGFMQLTGDIVHLSEMWRYLIADPYLEVFCNAILVYIICYFFCIIRVLFILKRFIGTLFFSITLSILFLFTGQVNGLTALNPFGYLALFSLNGTPEAINWPWFIFGQVLLPLGTVVVAYYFIKDKYTEDYENQKGAVIRELT